MFSPVYGCHFLSLWAIFNLCRLTRLRVPSDSNLTLITVKSETYHRHTVRVWNYVGWNARVISEQRTGQDMQDSVRGLPWGTITAFPWILVCYRNDADPTSHWKGLLKFPVEEDNTPAGYMYTRLTVNGF
jgi:hypothetical protein